MTVLGIDTSSTDLSISLSVDDSPVSTVCRYVRNSHAEHITQAVKLSLELGGVDVADVTHIAVSAGPGSFTGLRIGLSFVKGLCMMTERRVIPLSSLMVLAHAAGAAHHSNKKIYAALDARQGRIHWGSFITDDGAKIRRLSEDRLSSPEELTGELSPDDILVTDTMGYQRSAVFDQFADKAQIINAEKSSLQRGLSCTSLAFNNINNDHLWQSAQYIVPSYLQASAAEEKMAVSQ
ncbi:MAG: tRNA (adenosine(37)-N6)-threonylcarbamoyltransferase complex dimerization subunit type 1 TsaB [Chitinispirillia bacterium]|nr:tRNA (adenosine(37)-N6)-threonylcarbamoyltransferase complex dimerization subunit type 1 TsaB [Chitinispirillia bacterium]MCL2241217.1 tRNA (adenosine(37)-N6)-threonylcarbamoyltransferase complex dimerization subunit type 1 TsaB [Chitinispirillia bacterium]